MRPSCLARFHSLHLSGGATTNIWVIFSGEIQQRDRTHCACAQLHFASGAVDLVAEAFDVVERVNNEDRVGRQLALDGRKERPPSRLFELALWENELP